MGTKFAQSGLPEPVVDTVLRLLALDYPIKFIARRLNIARNTVRAIDRGEYAAPIANYKRCRDCGHRVLLPCLICVARKARDIRAA